MAFFYVCSAGIGPAAQRAPVAEHSEVCRRRSAGTAQAQLWPPPPILDHLKSLNDFKILFELVFLKIGFEHSHITLNLTLHPSEQGYLRLRSSAYSISKYGGPP